MAVVINTDIREVKVTVFGNYFTFKPGQVKQMDDNIAHFLVTDRGDLGFQSLPDFCLDVPESEEEKLKVKAAKDQATKEGRKRIVQTLTQVVRNLEDSMQRDLDMRNIKTPAINFASDGEIQAYERLAEFKVMEQDQAAKNRQYIEKLRTQIDGTSES